MFCFTLGSSLLFLPLILCVASSLLHDKFREFQELRPENFSVVTKRDASSGKVHFKIVTFYALGKYFVMHLFPGSPVLPENFEASSVDGDGRTTPFRVDKDIFFTGFLNGDPRRPVDAVQVDSLWVAQIDAPDDVYSIEPLTHHQRNASATSMLIVKHGAFITTRPVGKVESPPFCEEIEFGPISLSSLTRTRNLRERSVDNNFSKTHTTKQRNTTQTIHKLFNNEKYSKNPQLIHSIGNFTINSQPRPRRGKKRSSKIRSYDTCDIMVIADYEIYKGVGESNVYRVVSLLVHVFQAVDRIFRGSHFGELTNIGIAVTKFNVHTSYTKSSEPHYNMVNNDMTGKETLVSLTTIPNLGDYCLIHLTTQRNFGGTLGLAATAETRRSGWSNGICSRYQEESRNIGLSTTFNAENKILPYITYMLVVAHELGHNFGAHHDPVDDKVCSPSTENGGKYMMWTHSGQASNPNSKLFSPCSLKEIGRVLEDKSYLCFMPRELVAIFCGNGYLDPGEDCDPGFVSEDICCTKACRFSAGAVCSPYNHACCSSMCQVAPSTQKCYLSDYTECYEIPYCSGTDAERCPQPKPLPNHSSCDDRGLCWYGKCLQFCELMGMIAKPSRRLQSCSNEENRHAMCMHSCWNPEQAGACQILGGPRINGTPCLLGYCQSGFCNDPKDKVDILSDEYTDSKNVFNQAHGTSSKYYFFLLILYLCFYPPTCA